MDEQWWLFLAGMLWCVLWPLLLGAWALAGIKAKGGVMQTEKVMEVLRQVEFVGGGPPPAGPGQCPSCGGWESDWGHLPDCKLAALLSEGEKEKAAAKIMGCGLEFQEPDLGESPTG